MQSAAWRSRCQEHAWKRKFLKLWREVAIRPVICTCYCKYRTFNGLQSPDSAGRDNLKGGNCV
jgi:hypothetical protein